jgi:hypothetical protein
MKLNFWQWLGLILLIVGLIMFVMKRSRPADAGNSGTAPVVQPTR